MKLLGYLAAIGATAATAYAGSIASVRSQDFYAALERPSWAPPSSVFGPVWTILYVFMAIAACLVIASDSSSKGRALVAFGIQLVLNGLWSWLFFAWRMGGLAFLEICVLWVAILMTTIMFWRVRPLAGVMLLPYLAWVGFAAALNFAIWQMNPGSL